MAKFGLLFGVWTVIGVVLCLLVVVPLYETYFAASVRPGTYQYLLYGIIGFFLPLTSKLVAPPPNPTPTKNPVLLWVLGKLIWLNESAKFEVPIYDQERLAGRLVNDERYQRAIDRLYEWHSEHIARRLGPDGDPIKTIAMLRVRDRSTKLKYLLRFMKRRRLNQQLQKIADQPSWILPSWPADQLDRRKHDRRRVYKPYDVDRRKLPSGRRKSDSLYVHEFVLSS